MCNIYFHFLLLISCVDTIGDLEKFAGLSNGYDRFGLEGFIASGVSSGWLISWNVASDFYL